MRLVNGGRISKSDSLCSKNPQLLKDSPRCRVHVVTPDGGVTANDAGDGETGRTTCKTFLQS